MAAQPLLWKVLATVLVGTPTLRNSNNNEIAPEPASLCIKCAVLVICVLNSSRAEGKRIVPEVVPS